MINKTPLEGIRVIDFSRMLPGPWCTQMLGDLGCDVIKIEQPEVGDLARHNPPSYRSNSVYFHTVNLNKRSVSIDLTEPKGLETARELIRSADIVVESYRKGVAARLGIGYEMARRLNPSIIYCSVTGFGQSGPFSGIPGHDLVVQAIAGVIDVGEGAEGKPSMPSFQAADYAAATYAVIGILAALHKRRTSGEGCFLDISMFDALVSMTNVISGAALARMAGYEVNTSMELWGKNPRYATYRTRDGRGVAVSLLEAKIWNNFCQLIGRADLINPNEAPRDRHTAHGERSQTYREVLEAFCLAHDRDELVAWALDHDVPILPVLSPDETLRSSHVAERALVEWLDHPQEGRIPVIANPLTASGLTRVKRKPAPAIGEHTQEICRELARSRRRSGV